MKSAASIKRSAAPRTSPPCFGLAAPSNLPFIKMSTGSSLVKAFFKILCCGSSFQRSITKKSPLVLLNNKGVSPGKSDGCMRPSNSNVAMPFPPKPIAMSCS